MNAINAGIDSKIGTLNAYNLQAPKDTALPYIVWNWQGGGLTPDHDIINGVEWVRAYGTSSYQAGTLYSAADALLNGGTLTVAGYSVVSLRREDMLEFVETPEDGEPVYTKGAYYRIILDA